MRRVRDALDSLSMHVHGVHGPNVLVYGEGRVSSGDIYSVVLILYIIIYIIIMYISTEYRIETVYRYIIYLKQRAIYTYI